MLIGSSIDRSAPGGFLLFIRLEKSEKARVHGVGNLEDS